MVIKERIVLDKKFAEVAAQKRKSNGDNDADSDYEAPEGYNGDGVDIGFTADLCYICVDRFHDSEELESKELLVCDSCNYKVAHFSCLKMVTAPPENEEWICKDCVEESKQAAIALV